MNKKGFTLLELLAVIVVLAVIALIVTPFVTKAIEEAKKGAFKNSAYGLLEVAELYCSQESLKNGGEYRGERFEVVNHQLKSTTTNNILKFKGTTPVGESYVEIDEDCKVELNITNGTYFASIEDDETDITITEEELDSRETLAQRLDALEALVASNNTTLTNNMANYWEEIYPIGSKYTTSTNVNPSTILGGTWVLEDKSLAYNYKSATYASDPDEIFTPSENISDYTINALFNDHEYRIMISFMTAVDLADTNVVIGTLNYEKFGISRLDLSHVRKIAASDAANGIAMVSINAVTGGLYTSDIIAKDSTATSLVSGRQFNIDLIGLIPKMHISNDSYCDEFVWKRTS